MKNKDLLLISCSEGETLKAFKYDFVIDEPTKRFAAVDHFTFTLINVIDRIRDRLKCLSVCAETQMVQLKGQSDRNKRGRDIG